MKKESFRSVLLPLILLPCGGLLALGICYLLYFGVYMLVETQFFPNDPTAVPAGIIRNSYAVALLILYLPLLRARIPDLIKATLLIGPLTTLIIAAVLACYKIPILAISVTAAIAAGCGFLVYRGKKPWFYYYAIGLTVLAGIAYAWPAA